jgi:multiple antibiotic resistance protein
MSTEKMGDQQLAGTHKKEGKAEKRVISGVGIKWIIMAALAIVFILLYQLVIDPAMQASFTGDQSTAVSTTRLPIAKVFTVLFLMLGPFKIIGPFASITRGADARMVRRVALLATAFSCLALLFAAFLGGSIIRKFGIPVPVLALAAGLILSLVALIAILQQFKPATLPESDANVPLVKKATSFAFPTIVTPYGIAALVVFLALAPNLESRMAIGAVVIAILLVNLISMLLTPHIYRALGIVLQLLGAVLGIIQVALGIQIISNSLKEMLK